uniref:Glycoprotein n=1 Tax=Hymenopteran phasma-related virus OKIAV232 TaxID=2792586 RepID=A0A7T0Q5E3_9VIRU|nr:glycoprotein [Hymenopteran phasma-related virus OKIAV232]
MEEKMKIGIIILIFTSLSYCYDINANYGKITIPDNDNCTLLLNDTKIEAVNGKVPGLHYGLIQYECGHHKGFILSKPECYECGIYCPQNDRLLNCRQFGLPYLLGFITSLLLSVILVIFMHKWGFNWISILISSLKDHRRVKRENRYVKYISKFNARNMNQQIYNPPPQTTSAPKMKKYPSLTEIAVGTLMLTADRSYACDRTLFMHSNGQICDKVKCQDINSYTFNIGIGKTICFNTPTRDMMKFQITNTKEVSTYQELYETSDYEIELESTSSCKQVGLCYKEYCHKNAKHPDFKNGTGVHGYDCESEGLGCDFMCWHKYACTWYYWWFRNVGNRAAIFKRTTSIWSFDLLVTYKELVERYTFNSDLTQNDLDIGKLFSINNMPINVNNVIKANFYISDYIVRDGFSFYEATANDINNLTPGRLGDYQISLDNRQSIYKNNEIQCRTTGCKVICSGPEPSLRVFRSLKHKNIVEEYNILDDYSIRVLKSVPMSVNLNIGNVEFKNLFVEQANCDLNVIQTFGCIGCDKMPYAIIQSSKIVNHGVLPFISNCTFNRKTLSCSEDLTKLVPISKYNSCHIYIPVSNKTLNIEFKYEFFGELSVPEDIYSHDNGFKGILKSISGNPNFLDTLTYGAFAFTGIGIAASMITKIVLRSMAIKKSKETEKEIEMQDC